MSLFCHIYFEDSDDFERRNRTLIIKVEKMEISRRYFRDEQAARRLGCVVITHTGFSLEDATLCLFVFPPLLQLFS